MVHDAGLETRLPPARLGTRRQVSPRRTAAYSRAPFGLTHLPERPNASWTSPCWPIIKRALYPTSMTLWFLGFFDEHVERRACPHRPQPIDRLELEGQAQKCVLFQPSIEFSGFIVSATGISPAPDKL